MLVRDIMSTQLATVRLDATLVDAGYVMLEHWISGLPVVDEQDRLLGVISEFDLIRADPSAKLVKDVMSDIVISVGPTTKLEEATKFILENRIHRLPVVDKAGKLVGIVTSWDLLKAFTRRQTQEPVEKRAAVAVA